MLQQVVVESGAVAQRVLLDEGVYGAGVLATHGRGTQRSGTGVQVAGQHNRRLKPSEPPAHSLSARVDGSEKLLHLFEADSLSVSVLRSLDLPICMMYSY